MHDRAAAVETAMKIGRLEIRWGGGNGSLSTLNSQLSTLSEAELRGALALPDTNVQYRAFLQIIAEVEMEGLTGARTQVVNRDLCVNSLGIADGAALVRSKLVEIREEALRARRVAQ